MQQKVKKIIRSVNSSCQEYLIVLQYPRTTDAGIA